MLFGKRKRIVKRILIVEDEPLTAFDNETMLIDAGYEIVATLDDFEEALELLEREQVDLILSDVRLRSQETGIDLAKGGEGAGHSDPVRDRPSPMPARRISRSAACSKPYTERQLRQGDRKRRPASLGREGQAAQGARAVRPPRRGRMSRHAPFIAGLGRS